MNFTIQQSYRLGAFEFTRADIRHTILASIPAAIALAVVIGYAAFQIYGTNAQLAQEYARYDTDSASGKPLVLAQQRVNAASSTLATLRTHREADLVTLKRLAFLDEALPGKVRLTSVVIDGIGMTLQGETSAPGDLIDAQKNVKGLSVSQVSTSQSNSQTTAFAWNGEYR